MIRIKIHIFIHSKKDLILKAPYKYFEKMIARQIHPYHRGRQAIASINGLDDILIGPIPIWPLSVCHHLPHNHSVTPNVRGRCELPISYGFWGGPSHRNLATLRLANIFKIFHYDEVLTF